jgi:hypothetical protein
LGNDNLGNIAIRLELPGIKSIKSIDTPKIQRAISTPGMTSREKSYGELVTLQAVIKIIIGKCLSGNRKLRKAFIGTKPKISVFIFFYRANRIIW